MISDVFGFADQLEVVCLDGFLDFMGKSLHVQRGLGLGVPLFQGFSSMTVWQLES